MSNDFVLPPYRVDMLIAADAAEERPQWWLTDEKIDQWHDRTRAGVGVRVGIIDTGIDSQHLQRGELPVEDARDFTGSAHKWRDINGHGTHVAGIIGARDNELGVIGLAPQCKLYIAKALGDNGSGSHDGIAAAIRWLVSNGCEVINMSLGSPRPSTVLANAISYAVNNGTLLVAAAGNGGSRNGVNYPAAYPEVFAVGAVDRKKQLARFSDRGPQVQGVGFGVQMVSLYRGGQLAALSGTSMATPWITGMIANRLSVEAYYDAQPTEDMAALDQLYLDTSDDLGTKGRDPEFGHGFPVADKLFTLDIERDDDKDDDDCDMPEDEPGQPDEPSVHVTVEGTDDTGQRYRLTMPRIHSIEIEPN